MKFPAYPKYRDSGMQWLGEVPEHWEVKRGRFAIQINPPSPKVRALNPDSKVSFVPMEAVNEYGGLRLDQTKIKDEIGGGYTEFQDNDVVVAKITPCFENGKGSLAIGLFNSAAYGTTELHVLRAESRLDNRFLFYMTITDGFRKLGESEMYGAGGQKRVPPEFCKNFQTPLPPLSEQTTIANFLDRETGRIDTLLAKKRRLIGMLDEKRTALISRTVTRGLPADVGREFGLEPHTRFKDSGIDWLGEVPVGWEVLKVSREISIAEGQVNPEQEPYSRMILIGPEHVESGTGCLLEKSTAADQSAISGKYFCKAGDVIYSKIRPALRKLVITPKNCLCSADMYPLRGRSRLKNKYIYWLLLSDQFLGWSVLKSDRVAMPKINRNTLNELRIPIPPLPEQTAIATYLDRETAKIDRLKEKVETAITQLQEYRSALITAAVTGKIDVRNAAA